MYFIWAYCFERVQVHCISAWVFDLWACFTVDLLWGRGAVIMNKCTLYENLIQVQPN